jgi:pyrroline-5-carboxylate reductase
MERIGFIGAGNMAEAIIRGIIAGGVVKPQEVTASDIRAERLKHLEAEYGIHTTGDNGNLVSESKITFLSVKPQNMGDVLNTLLGRLSDDSVIISIAAGITTDFIAGKLGDVQIIRTMPNTPAMIGEGVTAIYNRSADAGALKRARELLSAVGKTVVIEDEALLDLVTAVSGSGPAYFFLLMEGMTAAAKALGLPGDIAETLVCQTALGAGRLASLSQERNESPEDLRKKVTSPGGTTAAAISLFQEKNFAGTVMEAIKRARDRGRELSSGS